MGELGAVHSALDDQGRYGWQGVRVPRRSSSLHTFFDAISTAAQETKNRNEACRSASQSLVVCTLLYRGMPCSPA
jgi:hypothetical protein